ncbi:unnamed protein product [Urochloa humidicola]
MKGEVGEDERRGQRRRRRRREGTSRECTGSKHLILPGSILRSRRGCLLKITVWRQLLWIIIQATARLADLLGKQLICPCAFCPLLIRSVASAFMSYHGILFPMTFSDMNYSNLPVQFLVFLV